MCSRLSPERSMWYLVCARTEPSLPDHRRSVAILADPLRYPAQTGPPGPAERDEERPAGPSRRHTAVPGARRCAASQGATCGKFTQVATGRWPSDTIVFMPSQHGGPTVAPMADLFEEYPFGRAWDEMFSA